MSSEMRLLSEWMMNTDSLTTVERKIATEVLRDPKKFIVSTINGFSEKVGVSQGSINNFAKKFTGGGFADLKLRIAQEVSGFSPRQYTDLQDNSLQGVLNSYLQETIDCLTHTSTMNETETLQKAAEHIRDAKRVNIFGVYQSGIVAQDFSYRLLCMGIPASYVSDTLMCSVSATSLDEKCVLFAISGTGKTKEILDAVRIAHQQGAYVIGLTYNRFSPLAKLSDCVLVSANGISECERTNQARMAQLFLLDALTEYLQREVGAGEKERYELVHAILESHSVEE